MKGFAFQKTEKRSVNRSRS